jgi:hypothetical protein
MDLRVMCLEESNACWWMEFGQNIYRYDSKFAPYSYRFYLEDTEAPSRRQHPVTVEAYTVRHFNLHGDQARRLNDTSDDTYTWSRYECNRV